MVLFDSLRRTRQHLLNIRVVFSVAARHPHAQSVQECGGVRPAGCVPRHDAHSHVGDVPDVRQAAAPRQTQQVPRRRQGRPQVLHGRQLLLRSVETGDAQGHGTHDARPWEAGELRATRDLISLSMPSDKISVLFKLATISD
jgi:hypothetical protein